MKETYRPVMLFLLFGVEAGVISCAQGPIRLVWDPQQWDCF